MELFEQPTTVEFDHEAFMAQWSKGHIGEAEVVTIPPPNTNMMLANNHRYHFPGTTTDYIILTPRDYRLVRETLEDLVEDNTLSLLDDQCGMVGLFAGRKQTYRTFFHGMLQKSKLKNARTKRTGEDWTLKQMATFNRFLGEIGLMDCRIGWHGASYGHEYGDE